MAKKNKYLYRFVTYNVHGSQNLAGFYLNHRDISRQKYLSQEIHINYLSFSKQVSSNKMILTTN